MTAISARVTFILGFSLPSEPPITFAATSALTESAAYTATWPASEKPESVPALRSSWVRSIVR